MFASRWRRVIQIFMMVSMSKQDEPTEGVWAGLFWLLDRYHKVEDTVVDESENSAGCIYFFNEKGHTYCSYKTNKKETSYSVPTITP